MKWFAIFLFALLGVLQYRLWVGPGSYSSITQLNKEIDAQQREIHRLKIRNERLAMQIEMLKNNSDSIEIRARRDLGMIKKGETYVMIIDAEE